MGMGFFSRISGLRLRQYESVQMLEEDINSYMAGDFSSARAAENPGKTLNRMERLVGEAADY